MSSPAGGYGAGAADAHHQQHHGHTVLLSHAQHMAAAAAAAASGGQLFHVPQHSRREKLRFPPDAAEDSPPTTTPSHLAPHHHHHHNNNNNQAGAWPPPAFYSYASSSSSYSPHSPTAPQGQQQQQQQLVLNGLTAQQLTAQAQQLPQIPTQNFSLTLSSASSNPATTPPTPRRQQQQKQQLGGGPSQAAGPCGPFTGYAAVLGRSKFLSPAQKLLAEICDAGGAAAHADRSVPDDGLLDADPLDATEDAAAIHELNAAGTMSGAEQQWKKTRLISMMEEVCMRYRQYYQQVQAVITSFESVAGFSNAAPFTALALRLMAKHFRHIKAMILSQLRNTSKMPVKEEGMRKDITIFGLGGNAPVGGFRRGSSGNGFGQPQNIWRPQRGLPERSVTVLRAWLFEHFLHPYPTDGEKQMLAKQTGLSRNQVSNWFINARVRLWKPMVEEIHNLEMRQYSLAHDKGQGQGQQQQHGQATHQHSLSQQRSGKRSEPCDSQPGQSSGVTRNHGHSHPAAHGFPDELPQMPHSMQGQVSFTGYSALPSQQQHNGMASTQQQHQIHHHVGGGGGNGGVSLTLGLHQNNKVCFGEPLPANLAHRFGLMEDVNDPYVMGSFGGGQDRHFAKEIGGHLLHDFVG